jgi:LAO/AO transport system kinase
MEVERRSAETDTAKFDAGEMAVAVRAGDRRALARAITLAESDHPDHAAEAVALIDALLPETGGAIRPGSSGAPGVGKSTFIETFGMYLLGQGHRVAVLAVDPTSRRSGGSILGDKTRMDRLARAEQAFIRPSPAGNTLGGVARRTGDPIALCEAAGFDVVIVETVGVGQSETAVSGLVDMFLLIIAPGGGDELQGIKRGIVELADLVLVNKNDGDLRDAASRIASEYQGALSLLRSDSPDWTVPVMRCSALKETGIENIWAAVERHREMLTASGEKAHRRARQAKETLWAEITEALLAELRDAPSTAAMIPALETEVATGNVSPRAAAQQLLGKSKRDGND